MNEELKHKVIGWLCTIKCEKNKGNVKIPQIKGHTWIQELKSKAYKIDEPVSMKRKLIKKEIDFKKQ